MKTFSRFKFTPVLKVTLLYSVLLSVLALLVNLPVLSISVFSYDIWMIHANYITHKTSINNRKSWLTQHWFWLGQIWGIKWHLTRALECNQFLFSAARKTNLSQRCWHKKSPCPFPKHTLKFKSWAEPIRDRKGQAPPFWLAMIWLFLYESTFWAAIRQRKPGWCAGEQNRM